MKKVLFTCALALTFAAAQANDGVSSKETGKGNIVRPTKKTVVIQPSNKVNKKMLMPECFALSCGTACDYGEDASEFYAQFDIEDVFNALEEAFC